MVGLLATLLFFGVNVTDSHDLELTRILEGEYDNYHFRESMREGQVCFDYTLVPGPYTGRNAIVLLGSLDFPAPVEENAQGLVDAFEAAGSWLGNRGIDNRTVYVVK